MNNNELVLSRLIRSSLFGVPFESAEGVDWNEVLIEARAQMVVPLVAKSVPTDAENFKSWDMLSAQFKANFIRLLYEQTTLSELLKNAQIPFVIIKGTSVACYYPDPATRTMGDIDVLVSEEDFDAAFKVLQSNDYKFSHDYGDDRDYSFLKHDVIFELHKKYSTKEYDIEPFIQGGIKNSDTLTVFGNSFPALNKARNGLVLLDHIRHHLFGGLGLRQVIDFMMFVNSEPDEEKFLAEYFPLFEQAGLSTLAKIITKTCKKYFGLPVSATWCDSADDKTCYEFLEYVFKCGNFGRKNPYEYRPMQSFTMSVKEQGFFRTLQKAGVENCKAFKKHKALRPFAWLYQLLRYSKRGVVAVFKREKLTNDISEGKQKADFYKRLGIK